MSSANDSQAPQPPGEASDEQTSAAAITDGRPADEQVVSDAAGSDAALELVAEVDGELPAEEAAPLPDGMDLSGLANVIEAVLLAAESPLSLDALQRLIAEDMRLEKRLLRAALASLGERYEGSSIEVREVASGYRIQVREGYAPWVHRLWQDKPPRLSRALMETLAIICYRQPVTRGEIEEIRGVTVSSNILRTLLERGWVREVGVKEVPGRPSLFGTTSQLLDDLGLASLDALPSLPEIKDPAQLEAALARLGLGMPALAAPEGEAGAAADELSTATDTDTDTDTDADEAGDDDDDSGAAAAPVIH